MKIVIFLCEEIEHIRFFLAMKKAFNKLGYKCIYLTMDLGLYFKYKNILDEDIILVKKKNKLYYSENIVAESKEVVEGYLNQKEAEEIYNSVNIYLDKLNLIYNIDFLFSSQGVRIAEIALRDWSIKNDKKCLFYELANIDKKVFFDREGSNALSFLYRNMELLDKYNIDDETFLKWKKNYIETHLKQHKVKQAEKSINLEKKYKILSRLGFIYTGLKLRRFKLSNKFYNLWKKNKEVINFDDYNINNNKYIFFPLQVASDSQIILNSDISLINALKYSIDLSKKENCDLVVKFHPAERDYKVIKKILEMKSKYNFKIINDNTFEVIKKSQKVVTINSTVALEAKILDKEVIILGRSYYKYFNYNRLKNYILGYLVNMDYFSDKDYTEKQIKDLINRFKI